MRATFAILPLLSLFSASFAAEAPASAEDYDATVYLTSTVYLVNTVTLPGSQTTALANHTSTYVPHYGTGIPSNGSSHSTPTSPPASEFTGAADRLSVGAAVALVAGVVGVFAL